MVEPEVEETVTEDTGLAGHRLKALIIVGIILPFLIEPFLSLIFYQKGESYFVLFAASRFLIWATLGLLFLYSRYAEVLPFTLWDEESYRWTFYVQWLIVLFLLYICAECISYIPNLLGPHEQSPKMEQMRHLMKEHPDFGMFTALTAGITEELFFRGYMMGRLALFFKNKHHIVLISSLLFCAIHISYHVWGEIIFTFLIGLIFGYHYYRYRNLKILVAMHFIIDAIATIIIANHR